MKFCVEAVEFQLVPGSLQGYEANRFGKTYLLTYRVVYRAENGGFIDIDSSNTLFVPSELGTEELHISLMNTYVYKGLNSCRHICITKNKRLLLSILNSFIRVVWQESERE